MISSARTLTQLLLGRAQSQPETVAYTFLSDGETSEVTLSYAELDAGARRIAGRLLETLSPGDRALLLYQPGLDYVAAFFGCLYAGVIAVPAYPPRARRALPRLLALARESGASAALTSQSVYAGLAERTAALPDDAAPRWIVADLSSEGPSAVPAALSPDAIAFLQYTSGSTATPKGVVLSHANLIDNLGHIHQRFGHDADSRGVIWLPPYHDMGLIGGILQPLYGGFPVTLMSPFSFLQRPLRWLEAISRQRATTSGGPNFAYQLLADRVSDEQLATLDLSSWRVAFTGAEPVRVATLEQFASRFADSGFERGAFYPCYGLAEATLMVSGGRLGDGPVVARLQRPALERGEAQPATEAHEARELVAYGTAVDGHEIAIIDPGTRVAAAAGRVGEIWVRGPSVAERYWNRAEESAQLLQAERADTGEGPYLRTGDLGFLHSGELYITGRIKELILIAGRNLYPHDVELSAEACFEGLRRGCGAAFSVDSEAEERLVLVQELEREAIRSLDAEPVFRDIRRTIAEEHEAQLAAIVLVKPGSIPKTSSGKIQRAVTRQRYLDGELDVVAEWAPSTATASLLDPVGPAGMVPPRTPVESTLAEIWGEVLERDIVGVHDDFFEWGGQSLLATQVMSRIGDTFAVDLPVRTLFEAPTIAALALQVEAALGGEARVPQEIRPLDAGQPLPLAYSQERMWFIHQLQPESSAYNLALGLRLRGSLDENALRRAMQRIVERHDSLRTRIVSVDGQPTQVVEPELLVELTRVDLRTLPAASRDVEMRERIRHLAAAPFDLARLPLMRLALLRLDEQEQVLAIIMHHVISDAWTYSILARELGALYHAYSKADPDPLPPLTLQYADFAAWQRDHFTGERLEKQVDYWRQRLDGVPVLSLPTDHPRLPMQRGHGSMVTVTPEPSLLEALRALSRAQNTTLFMTLLSAFVVLMHRYSGQQDFAIGVPIANRHHQASEKLIGTLVNTLALRFDLSGEPSFLELLARVRDASLGAYAHQDLPFEQLVAKLDLARDLSHGPLFQVMFDFINVAAPETRIGDLSLSLVEVDRGAAQFDLTLVVMDTRASQHFSFEYDSDLFERETVERMMAELMCLLRNALVHPEQSISEIELLPASERRLLLESWNDTEAEFSNDRCLDQLISDQARRSPDALAVRHGELRLSYGELEQRSDDLARYLRGLGVGSDVPVGLCLERSLDMVVALLGVLKAGGAYVPLDPAFPRERLRYMLDDSEAPVLLTQASLAEWIGGDDAARTVVLMDQDWEAIESAPHAAPPPRRSPDDLAYLIYTSGSTGKPKGVELPHRAVVNFLESMRQEPGLTAADVLLSVTTLSFDIAVLELYLPLITGATTVVVDRELNYDGQRLGEVLDQVGATVMQATPATWRLLLDAGWPGRPGLKALCGGEPLPRDLAQQLLGRVDSLWNMYGPTETAVWSTTRRISSVETPITVGHPIANTRTYILDERQQPVPLGVSGELWIGGEGVARGYRKRPELTAERFRPDPFNPQPGARMYATGDLARFRPGGDIEVLGRLDFQVKVRGFRIELGEIEDALSQIDGVHQAVVSARDDDLGVKRLVGYLLAESADPEARPSVTELRHRLLESLPDYMVPGQFVFLDTLPLTPNGKIDRLALPEPEALRPSLEQHYEAPRTPFEVTLAEICADLLQLDRVGIRDNFFALGGHSLLATRMVARIRESLGAEVPLRIFFDRPSVAELAAYIGEQETEALDDETLEELMAEIRELAPDDNSSPDAGDPAALGRRQAPY
jgi:amino acid adenylation domain-containing protein